jgi:hypothetical protein
MVSLTALNKFIWEQEHPQVSSLHTFITRQFGYLPLGLLVENLVKWFPKTKRDDLGVYKSHRHHARETAITEAQVRRIHEEDWLEQLGITYKILKAEGAPTRHYYFNDSSLIELLAKFFNKTAQFVHQELERLEASIGSGGSTASPKTPKFYTPKVTPVHKTNNSQFDETYWAEYENHRDKQIELEREERQQRELEIARKRSEALIVDGKNTYDVWMEFIKYCSSFRNHPQNGQYSPEFTISQFFSTEQEGEVQFDVETNTYYVKAQKRPNQHFNQAKPIHAQLQEWIDMCVGRLLGKKCKVEIDLSIKDKPITPKLE